VTTLMTTPILAGIYPIRLFGREALTHQRAKLGGFSVLVPVSLPDSGPAMARLAASLIGPPKAGGNIVAVHLRRPSESQEYAGGVDEVDATNDPTLLPLIEQAREIGAQVEPISFITRDVADDIAQLAAARQVELVLMGFHKPVFGRTILGGTVHNVMSQCGCDVAVFVDRGVDRVKRVLVPFLGSVHDRLALELAARMAKSTEVAVTVLHVTPPARAGSPAVLDTKGTVERVFSDPSLANSVTVRTVEDNSPVSAVLRESSGFDLIVLGVSEEWGLESRLFGWRAERVAKESPTSLLIVRKFVQGPDHAVPSIGA
jgi:nucleotide-binding universal stress UspA family protein